MRTGTSKNENFPKHYSRAHFWYNDSGFVASVITPMSDPKYPSPPANKDTVSETVQFNQQPDVIISTTDSLPTGTRLGHYVIRKYIGGGGMGRVYLATDAALDRDVAIKVLTEQRASDQSTVARFMNEARSAARLNHEHIAQVYFAGETSGIPFIAFEYVEGINVRTMVEDHDVFPLPQALNYLLQIAHALVHAASHGVVHRDVKPSNILITREGRAKLIDMGLARLLDTAEARNDLTASGVTLGTFDYISPEQARDPRNADIRSDIYSLGCTFFFMLAGRPPFPEGTVLQKLLQHQGDAPPDIRSFQPAIPAEIAFLIQKMMAKDPKQRFQTPTVLIEALTDAARRLGLRPAGQGDLVWAPTRSHRKSFLLRHLPWMGAVALLFLGYFLMSLFHQTGTTPFPAPPNSLIAVPENPPLPDEPLKDSPFEFAFVPLSTAPPTDPWRVTASLTSQPAGGSLQPAFMIAGQFPPPASDGQLSIAKLERKQSTATQRVRSSSEVRCVDPTGNTPDSYLTLAAALVDAEDGTVIKLKWNRIHSVAEPIQLDRRKLIFEAEEGFDPVLRFEPTESHNTRSFWAVFSSHLEFHHVGIEMRINPIVVSPQWSLFELSGSTQLTFKQCCLTVQNISTFDNSASHDDVAFFRNGMPTGILEGARDVGDMIFEPLTIHVTNSLLRGEAVAIQSNVSQDIDVRFSDSLIALASPFVFFKEPRRAVRQATIQIRWDRVAFFGRQGFASLTKEVDAEPMVVDVDSQQSFFVLNRSPFAVFRGSQSRQKALTEFRWRGSGNLNDPNYFQGVLGLRFPASSLSPNSGAELSLGDWSVQWTQETRDQTKIDTLPLIEIGKPMSRFLPQDMRSSFGSAESLPLPDFGWFPVMWSD